MQMVKPESDSTKFAGRLLGHFLTNWTRMKVNEIECQTNLVTL